MRWRPYGRCFCYFTWQTWILRHLLFYTIYQQLCHSSVTSTMKAERQGTNTSFPGSGHSRYNVFPETREKTIIFFIMALSWTSIGVWVCDFLIMVDFNFGSSWLWQCKCSRVYKFMILKDPFLAYGFPGVIWILILKNQPSISFFSPPTDFLSLLISYHNI